MHTFEKNLDLDTILSSVNLAEELDEKDLAYIGEAVKEGFDLDCQSRKEWEKNHEEVMKLALQTMEEKTWPWRGASNVKYPLITVAALQFSARAYAALINGSDIVKGKVIGYDETGEKKKKAERVGYHMSYQLLEQMPNWEEETDKLLVALPIVGCMFKKTYRDGVDNVNVSEIIFPRNFVVDYWTKNLESAQRYTHVIERSANYIYERQALGIYREVDLEKSTKPTENDEVANAQGFNQPSGDARGSEEVAPYRLLEQYLYLDLDGDGYKEPYIAVVNDEDGQVLRIVANFQEEDVQYADNDGKVAKIRPAEYFTKYGFIPNPDGGFYDIGFGDLAGPLNDAVNTIINQLVDSGTLYNLQAGFISRGLRIRSGKREFDPGEWKVVESSYDDLAKGIYPLPVKEPSTVLFSLLGLLIDTGKNLVSTPDIVMGENPGQNQPMRTSMQVLEQGLSVYRIIHKRIYRSYNKELKKLFVLNSKFMDGEEYFRILDPNKDVAETAYRSDYDLESVDVMPASDPNMIAETQKLMRLQRLMQLIPLGTVNPQEVTKRFLEAEQHPGIEELMTMPPPKPNPEMQLEIMNAELEKQKFFDESKREWKKLENEEEKIRSGAINDEANSVLALAKAEAEAVRGELEYYKTQIEHMRLALEDVQNQREAEREANEQSSKQGNSNERGVSGMEGSSNNSEGI